MKWYRIETAFPLLLTVVAPMSLVKSVPGETNSTALLEAGHNVYLLVGSQGPQPQANIGRGAQTVTGSWEGGYDVACTGIKTLVIEFLPVCFSVITASITPLPDRHETVSFTA